MKAWLLGVGIIATAFACSKSSKKPLANIKTCDPPPGGSCNTVMCGGNSALINAFPVHGLRPDGECSDEQIQLVPGSLDGACDGATLDMQGNRLVGRMEDGTIKCQGSALKGTSFEVRSWKGSERIEITEVTEYNAPNGVTRPAYRMEWTKQPDKDPNGKRQGLCAKEGQKLRLALNLKAMKFTDDLAEPDKNLVIPIQSELYDEQGNAIPIRPQWKLQKREWMHLACVDDALAKRSVFHQQTSDLSRSRAALRMWTADYCGGLPFTVRGKWIAWANASDLEIEAQWTEQGAACVTAPRILRTNGVETLPTTVTKRLKDLCKGCTTVADWMKAATTCHKEDGTTVETYLQPCDPCSGPGCPLESRNVKSEP